MQSTSEYIKMTSARLGTFLIFAITIGIAVVAKSGRLPSATLGGIVISGVLACIIVTKFSWHLSPEKLVTLLLLVTFVSIAAIAIYGRFSKGVSDPILRFEPVIPKAASAAANGPKKLFVLIHGLGGDTKTWRGARRALHGFGDVVELNYDADPLSNASPVALATRMNEHIQALQDEGQYDEIVLIGHSVGALLARTAYLQAAEQEQLGRQTAPWSRVVRRLVLLAGMNRGWDVTGQKPLDMSAGKHFIYWFGSWYGRLTNTGAFTLSTETGAPFISNLRIEWMNWFRTHPDNAPLVVQLLGDIDDVVSDEDNKDLRAVAVKNFVWLRVRGTGHGDIVRFDDTTGQRDSYQGIGAYRQQKFMLAATGDEDAIKAQNDEQPFQRDETVSHIVFVLHGIRDLGEWSADFEQQLQKKRASTERGRLAVVSVRYGYFSMGSFLIRPDRQKYVRWFMDQYTETLARYPNATTIDFIGHSNGTYLLASALEQYDSLKLRRIAFAGSVVRTTYDWTRFFEKDKERVEAVRNYVGTRDWVVALFPRFFDSALTRWLKNDVGAAGFEGFQNFPAAGRKNVTILGEHAAFLDQVPQIAEFVTSPKLLDEIQVSPPAERAWSDKAVAWALNRKATLWLVWIALIMLIGYPGVRVAIAGGHQPWIPLALYLALVVALLARL